MSALTTAARRVRTRAAQGSPIEHLCSTREALATHRPRAVIANAGGARFIGSAPIVMNAYDVRMRRRATNAPVVAVHLEAINHCIEPRNLYEAIDGVLVPADGETLNL